MIVTTRARFVTQRIFGIPVVLAAATIAGLLIALFGDGMWDLLSAIVLAFPLSVLLRSLVRAAVRTRLTRTHRSPQHPW